MDRKLINKRPADDRGDRARACSRIASRAARIHVYAPYLYIMFIMRVYASIHFLRGVFIRRRETLMLFPRRTRAPGGVAWARL